MKTKTCECKPADLRVAKGQMSGKWRAICPHARVSKACATPTDARHWWTHTAR